MSIKMYMYIMCDVCEGVGVFECDGVFFAFVINYIKKLIANS